MKIGVTGYKGRLGSELVKRGCEPLDCDITLPETIIEAVRGYRTEDVIINCAAYTDVDGAITTDGYKLATKVNTMGVANLRTFTHSKLVHISTDYVFSGKHGPYDENARYSYPVNDYGFSKLGGEAVMVTSHNPGDMLIRTTGLYGGCSERHDFSRLILNSIQSGNYLDVTTEVVSNHTYIPHLVEALLQAVMLVDPPRILHLASIDRMSKFKFAITLAEVFGFSDRTIRAVKDIKEWKANRPKKAGLKVGLASKLGLPIFTIRDGLATYAKEFVR